MKVSTAGNIALSVKCGFAAGWGFIIIGNLAGATISVVLAYSLVVSYPRPLTTFRESLRVNWRSFCLLSGIMGMIVLRYAFHMAEVEVVLKCFSAAFIGVLLGEMIATPLVQIDYDREERAKQENKKD